MNSFGPVVESELENILGLYHVRTTQKSRTSGPLIYVV